MKILIIQNKRIGDVLLASIIPNHLKKIYPKSVITFFCYDYAAPVLQNNPSIDNIIKANDKELKKIRTLLKVASRIRKEKFDLVIDPYVKIQSQLLSLASGATKRVGFEKRTLPYAYTLKIPVLKKRVSEYGKAIDDRINLIQGLGNDEIEIDPNPKLYLTPEEIEQGREKLKTLNTARKTLMFGVLGSNSSKSLPATYTAEIVDFIVENYDVNILFNYMPSQQETVNEILKKIKDSDKIYPQIVGKNIREFIQIMHHCDVLIANEGGSVHIAKALDKATFTIFSPYIIKEFWATFENKSQNKSIHLKDFRPELFKNKSRKEISNQSEQLYQKFTPEFILPQLQKFMIENGF